MIKVKNNSIEVTDQLTICSLISMLTRTKRDGTLFRGYEMVSNDKLIVPKGYLSLIPFDKSLVVDETVTEIGDISIDGLESVIDSITLRPDQVSAITKMTQVRRGILQLATGAGKTECISGFLRNIHKNLGYYPKTLILEPSTYLVEATLDRLHKYGIPAKRYSETRGDFDGVVVTHPMSLNNDLKKDPTILSDMKIFITDECHRLTANTWRALIKYMSAVEFTLGVSASAVDSSKIPITNISVLSEEELQIVGATGPVILDIPASYYIHNKILANPVLLRVHHSATEFVPGYTNNWSLIRKNVLEAPSRSEKSALIASFFSSIGFKSLILVGTKTHAYSLMKLIDSYGLGDVCRASFGGGVFSKYDPIKKKPVTCKKDEDIIKNYSSGKYTILIGTSHIYEGMDIPNLDVVILGNVGQKPRKLIQGIGRGLRKTKTGNNAYVVDFTDHQSDVLSRHSLSRASVCRSVIGIEESNIYGDLSLPELKFIITKLEPERFIKED